MHGQYTPHDRCIATELIGTGTAPQFHGIEHHLGRVYRGPIPNGTKASTAESLPTHLLHVGAVERQQSNQVQIKFN